MSISFDFSGRGVVVTGGARGIGRAIAGRFLASGARVAIWDQDAEGLQAAKKELGASLVTAVVDIAEPDSCHSAAKTLGFSPTILVNNAGIVRDRSFLKMTHEEFKTVVNVNLVGTFNVTKALIGYFNNEAKHHRIINIASIVALYGHFGQSNYAAAKAGVIGFTKTLAKELGPKNFTVNAIAPGFTQTSMLESIPEATRAGMVARVPVGRIGSVDDIAHACLFLASPEAGYINGAVINVDGGVVC